MNIEEQAKGAINVTKNADKQLGNFLNALTPTIKDQVNKLLTGKDSPLVRQIVGILEGKISVETTQDGASKNRTIVRNESEESQQHARSAIQTGNVAENVERMILEIQNAVAQNANKKIQASKQQTLELANTQSFKEELQKKGNKLSSTDNSQLANDIRELVKKIQTGFSEKDVGAIQRVASTTNADVSAEANNAMVGINDAIKILSAEVSGLLPKGVSAEEVPQKKEELIKELSAIESKINDATENLKDTQEKKNKVKAIAGTEEDDVGKIKSTLERKEESLKTETPKPLDAKEREIQEQKRRLSDPNTTDKGKKRASKELELLDDEKYNETVAKLGEIIKAQEEYAKKLQEYADNKKELSDLEAKIPTLEPDISKEEYTNAKKEISKITEQKDSVEKYNVSIEKTRARISTIEESKASVESQMKQLDEKDKEYKKLETRKKKYDENIRRANESIANKEAIKKVITPNEDKLKQMNAIKQGYEMQDTTEYDQTQLAIKKKIALVNSTKLEPPKVDNVRLKELQGKKRAHEKRQGQILRQRGKDKFLYEQSEKDRKNELESVKKANRALKEIEKEEKDSTRTIESQKASKQKHEEEINRLSAVEENINKLNTKRALKDNLSQEAVMGAIKKNAQDQAYQEDSVKETADTTAKYQGKQVNAGSVVKQTMENFGVYMLRIRMVQRGIEDLMKAISWLQSIEDTSMELGIVSQMGIERIRTMRTELLLLATGYRQSAEEIGKARLSVVKTGVSLEESMKIVDAGLNLSKATFSDLTTSTESINKILLPLERTGEAAQKVAEWIYNIAVNTPASMASIDQALKQTAAVFGTLLEDITVTGTALDDYKDKLAQTELTMIGLIHMQGKSGSQAGTALKMFGERLKNPTKQATQAINRDLAIAGETNEYGGTLTLADIQKTMSVDFNKALNKMSSLYTRGIISNSTSLLAGNRNASTIGRMLSQIGGDIEGASKKYTERIDLLEASNKSLESWSVEIDKMKNSFSALRATTLESADIFKHVVRLVSGGAKGIASATSSPIGATAVQSSVLAVSALKLTAQFSALTTVAGVVTKQQLKLGDVLKSVGRDFRGVLGSGLKVGGIVAGIVVAGLAISNLYNKLVADRQELQERSAEYIAKSAESITAYENGMEILSKSMLNMSYATSQSITTVKLMSEAMKELSRDLSDARIQLSEFSFTKQLETIKEQFSKDDPKGIDKESRKESIDKFYEIIKKANFNDMKALIESMKEPMSNQGITKDTLGKGLKVNVSNEVLTSEEMAEIEKVYGKYSLDENILRTLSRRKAIKEKSREKVKGYESILTDFKDTFGENIDTKDILAIFDLWQVYTDYIQKYNEEVGSVVSKNFDLSRKAVEKFSQSYTTETEEKRLKNASTLLNPSSLQEDYEDTALNKALAKQGILSDVISAKKSSKLYSEQILLAIGESKMDKPEEGEELDKDEALKLGKLSINKNLSQLGKASTITTKDVKDLDNKELEEIYLSTVDESLEAIMMDELKSREARGDISQQTLGNITTTKSRIITYYMNEINNSMMEVNDEIVETLQQDLAGEKAKIANIKKQLDYKGKDYESFYKIEAYRKLQDQNRIDVIGVIGKYPELLFNKGISSTEEVKELILEDYKKTEEELEKLTTLGRNIGVENLSEEELDRITKLREKLNKGLDYSSYAKQGSKSQNVLNKLKDFNEDITKFSEGLGLTTNQLLELNIDKLSDVLKEKDVFTLDGKQIFNDETLVKLAEILQKKLEALKALGITDADMDIIKKQYADFTKTQSQSKVSQGKIGMKNISSQAYQIYEQYTNGISNAIKRDYWDAKLNFHKAKGKYKDVTDLKEMDSDKASKLLLSATGENKKYYLDALVVLQLKEKYDMKELEIKKNTVNQMIELGISINRSIIDTQKQLGLYKPTDVNKDISALQVARKSRILIMESLEKDIPNTTIQSLVKLEGDALSEEAKKFNLSPTQIDGLAQLTDLDNLITKLLADIEDYKQYITNPTGNIQSDVEKKITELRIKEIEAKTDETGVKKQAYKEAIASTLLFLNQKDTNTKLELLGALGGNVSERISSRLKIDLLKQQKDTLAQTRGLYNKDNAEYDKLTNLIDIKIKRATLDKAKADLTYKKEETSSARKLLDLSETKYNVKDTFDERLQLSKEEYDLKIQEIDAEYDLTMALLDTKTANEDVKDAINELTTAIISLGSNGKEPPKDWKLAIKENGGISIPDGTEANGTEADGTEANSILTDKEKEDIRTRATKLKDFRTKLAVAEYGSEKMKLVGTEATKSYNRYSGAEDYLQAFITGDRSKINQNKSSLGSIVQSAENIRFTQRALKDKDITTKERSEFKAQIAKEGTTLALGTFQYGINMMLSNDIARLEMEKESYRMQKELAEIQIKLFTSVEGQAFIKGVIQQKQEQYDSAMNAIASKEAQQADINASVNSMAQGAIIGANFGWEAALAGAGIGLVTSLLGESESAKQYQQQAYAKDRAEFSRMVDTLVSVRDALLNLTTGALKTIRDDLRETSAKGAKKGSGVEAYDLLSKTQNAYGSTLLDMFNANTISTSKWAERKGSKGLFKGRKRIERTSTQSLSFDLLSMLGATDLRDSGSVTADDLKALKGKLTASSLAKELVRQGYSNVGMSGDSINYTDSSGHTAVITAKDVQAILIEFNAQLDSSILTLEEFARAVNSISNIMFYTNKKGFEMSKREDLQTQAKEQRDASLSYALALEEQAEVTESATRKAELLAQVSSLKDQAYLNFDTTLAELDETFTKYNEIFKSTFAETNFQRMLESANLGNNFADGVTAVIGNTLRDMSYNIRETLYTSLFEGYSFDVDGTQMNISDALNKVIERDMEYLKENKNITDPFQLSNESANASGSNATLWGVLKQYQNIDNTVVDWNAYSKNMTDTMIANGFDEYSARQIVKEWGLTDIYEGAMTTMANIDDRLRSSKAKLSIEKIMAEVNNRELESLRQRSLEGLTTQEQTRLDELEKQLKDLDIKQAVYESFANGIEQALGQDYASAFSGIGSVLTSEIKKQLFDGLVNYDLKAVQLGEAISQKDFGQARNIIVEMTDAVKKISNATTRDSLLAYGFTEYEINNVLQLTNAYSGLAEQVYQSKDAFNDMRLDVAKDKSLFLSENELQYKTLLADLEQGKAIDESFKDYYETSLQKLELKSKLIDSISNLNTSSVIKEEFDRAFTQTIQLNIDKINDLLSKGDFIGAIQETQPMQDRILDRTVQNKQLRKSYYEQGYNKTQIDSLLGDYETYEKYEQQLKDYQQFVIEGLGTRVDQYNSLIEKQRLGLQMSERELAIIKQYENTTDSINTKISLSNQLKELGLDTQSGAYQSMADMFTKALTDSLGTQLDDEIEQLLANYGTSASSLIDTQQGLLAISNKIGQQRTQLQSLLDVFSVKFDDNEVNYSSSSSKQVTYNTTQNITLSAGALIGNGVDMDRLAKSLKPYLDKINKI